MTFNHHEIEPKWQKYWADHQSFKTTEDKDKANFYALDMFPYPSGQGLHVGHPEGYTATDILARTKRMQGFNVLHPMGWDAFGLPAEQYALDTGHDPAEFTAENIANFKRQINSLGFSYDWDREVNTTDPKYYKWTQWIFEKMYEKGLAYEAEIPVNWSPDLGTVVANEEVIDGKTERGGFPVYRKPMRQWVLKITAYADRLLDDLDELDWPDSIKEMQRNWIGRSEGALVTFKVDQEGPAFDVFTTRADTMYGVTYIVLAPEHELVDQITIPEQKAVVAAYQETAAKKSDLERTDLAKTKTGAFTGAYAINPVTGEKLPIWIADYVLASYGTGAIMAVPAHDPRDFEFATKFGLDIKPVVSGSESTTEVYTEDGVMINSDFLNGLDKKAATEKMIDWLIAHHVGKKQVNYRLRDWLFSRQRYWGEPIPIIHWEDGDTSVVPEAQLPLTLPKTDNIKPSGTGESPLANLTDWLNVVDENGRKGKRETNTMPQWAGSSWYYLRYIDPHNEQQIADPEKLQAWMPVDIYVGGAEHAVLHLLYARFWHKFLYDLGVVKTKEPFQRLYNQGMILRNHEKMSKSKGNVINPDDIVNQYGADTLRLYEMFMGPLDAAIDWSEEGIGGSRKFLDRVWRLFINDEDQVNPHLVTENDGKLTKVYHQTVKKVTEDFASMHFNTAISQLMVFINDAYKVDQLPLEYMNGFIQLLNPIAPHVTEELWQRLGHQDSIMYEPWPVYDEKYLVDDTVEIVLQINGKVRSKATVDRDLDRAGLEKIALADETIKAQIADKTVRKVIAVPGKLVNIVAN